MTTPTTLTPSKRILFAGGIFRDLVAYSERFPKEGETIFGTAFQTGFGGKTANQAVMCARLGGRASMLGMVGNDENGRAYVENFKANDVNSDHLGMVDGVATGVATILVASSTGQNKIVIVPGANALFSAERVDAGKDVFEGDAGAVVVGTEASHDGAIRVLELAREKGLPTITNAAPAQRDLDPRIFALTDVLCVNETEAELFAGSAKPMETEDDIREVMSTLLEKCPTVIITMGGRGSVLATRARPTPILIPAEPAAVVDTTGAGDAFVGALAFFMVEYPDLELHQTIKLAGQVATMTVGKKGTQSSFPYKKDIPEIFKFQ